MAALGHEQPYNIVAILACERLLPSVNQPLNVVILKCPIFNGSFHQQQSFKLLEKPFCEGLESARSCRLDPNQPSDLLGPDRIAADRRNSVIQFYGVDSLCRWA